MALARLPLGHPLLTPCLPLAHPLDTPCLPLIRRAGQGRQGRQGRRAAGKETDRKQLCATSGIDSSLLPRYSALRSSVLRLSHAVAHGGSARVARDLDQMIGTNAPLDASDDGGKAHHPSAMTRILLLAALVLAGVCAPKASMFADAQAGGNEPVVQTGNVFIVVCAPTPRALAPSCGTRTPGRAAAGGACRRCRVSCLPAALVGARKLLTRASRHCAQQHAAVRHADGLLQRDRVPQHRRQLLPGAKACQLCCSCSCRCAARARATTADARALSCMRSWTCRKWSSTRCFPRTLAQLCSSTPSLLTACRRSCS
jgi:hypothetical protein